MIFLWSSRKDLPLRNILIMCADLRRHCTDSSKLLVLGFIRLLSILIFVVLSLHVLIRAYNVKKTTIVCTLPLLYVDDMIITGDDIVEISSLKDVLSVRFQMTRLGEVDCFLGLETKKCDGYFLSKKGYAACLLQRFRI